MARARAAAAAQLTRTGPGQWRLDGDLNLATVAALARQQPAPGDTGQVELDLAGVRQPSSAGIALLLEWQAALLARDAELTLHNVPAAMHRLAALANVDALLGLVEPSASERHDGG